MNEECMEKLRIEIEKKKKGLAAKIMAVESRGRAASGIMIGQYRAYQDVLEIIDKYIAAE